MIGRLTPLQLTSAAGILLAVALLMLSRRVRDLEDSLGETRRKLRTVGE